GKISLRDGGQFALFARIDRLAGSTVRRAATSLHFDKDKDLPLRRRFLRNHVHLPLRTPKIRRENAPTQAFQVRFDEGFPVRAQNLAAAFGTSHRKLPSTRWRHREAVPSPGDKTGGAADRDRVRP